MTQTEIDALAGMVKRGALTLDQIIDPSYKAAVEAALQAQTE